MNIPTKDDLSEWREMIYERGGKLGVSRENRRDSPERRALTNKLLRRGR